MNALYYDDDMHAEKDDILFCLSVCWSLSVFPSVKSRWWVTFLTDQGDVLLSPCMNQEAMHLWLKHYHKPMINDDEFH